MSELKDDGDIETTHLKTRVYYPKKDENSFLEKISHLVHKRRNAKYVAGSILLFSLIIGSESTFPVFEEWLDLTTAGWFVLGAWGSPVLGLISAVYFPKISSYIQKKIPVIADYKPLLSKITYLNIFFFIVLALANYYTTLEINMTVIASLLTGSVIGGYYLDKWRRENT